MAFTMRSWKATSIIHHILFITVTSTATPEGGNFTTSLKEESTFARKRVRCRKVVTSQVRLNLDSHQVWILGLLQEKIQRVNHSKPKKVLFREETPHIQSIDHLRESKRGRRHQGTGLSAFIGVNNLMGWVEWVFQLFGGRVSGIGQTPIFWPLRLSLEPSLLSPICHLEYWCYNEYWGSVKREITFHLHAF